ncbi:uncharacterized protein PGRI_031200 [Penicillium griseofulvum]|uniref:F-box domain-containing protein n=1 Tax=Penicillium patulum TaxID=5078 RepID=A0A135LK16_PENPA|nr:uncharacterized protein PGRI_031200 [Penicillium griseofulvum]KXG49250.1 hypothetical protein PGRI_031200 [Penicillium griseofulvum]
MLTSSKAKPTLEALPTELLILILLEIPDLASLKSIVLSSPTFHQAYLVVRHEALCRIVKNQWGVLLGDAIAATRSRGLIFTQYKHESIALLDTWRRREEINSLALSSSNRIDEPGNLEEISHLFYLYKVFHFFLEDYAKNIPQPPWMEDDQWKTQVLPIKLSPSESHRLLRGLCRLQIYQNIFGTPEHLDVPYHQVGEKPDRNQWDMNKGPSGHCDPRREVFRLFFGTIPPWEYQEMACVWAYFKTMFDPIYKEMTAGLHELVDKHMSKDIQEWKREYFEFLPEDVMPYWVNIGSLSALEHLSDMSDSLASMGPEFVYRLMHETAPLIRRDMVMCNANDYSNSYFTDYWLNEDDLLPLLHPADRHAVQDFEYLWSTLPSVERPNILWKTMFLMPDPPEHTLERAMTLQGGREPVWRLGLAIFDDERLTAWETPFSKYTWGDIPDFEPDF